MHANMRAMFCCTSACTRWGDGGGGGVLFARSHAHPVVRVVLFCC